jgi:solute carrier family 25 protein 16
MCAKTAVAPLDRIKILLQAHSIHYKHLGVFSGLKGIVEKERFIALYKGELNRLSVSVELIFICKYQIQKSNPNLTRFSNFPGNGAQMVRIFPYAATQFTSFEQYKKLFSEKSRVGTFFAGSMAGVTAVALTYPLDTIRARLAFQVLIKQ